MNIEDEQNKNLLSRILGTFTQKELYQLVLNFNYFNQVKLSNTAKKSFIINKILDYVPTDEILGIGQISSRILKEYNKQTKIFEQIFMNLSMDDLTVICEELNKKDINTTKNTKKDIIYELLKNLDAEQLWKSKRFRDRFTPKYVTKTDLDVINRNIKSYKEELSLKNTGSKNEYLNILNKINDIINVNYSNTKNELSNLSNIFIFTNEDIDVLKVIYNESLKLDDNLTIQDIININKTIKGNYDRKKLNYLFNGLELMFTHYFLTNLKELYIKPENNLFRNIMQEEFDKIRQFGRAEIPDLRSAVCGRLGISERMFDDMVEELWKSGDIRLDVGAPIGQKDVKYLITKEGTRYFYISL